ncbi:30S ribosomal protein S1 [Alkaliphilus hydrothermalis]|uniref:Small subunit ribosomal protein S1/4-hydroxy-3-methylbut-2-enyl diphosphate reductase n=1 Tax=Alkaliphilus hydrothermalis TaxID=1482730 RepID=A0ABS2NMD6_9FIRM|nr:30S ribosomal protein S1 [Alkaliphilus hydrothermalis]MBM7614099.1 small subunit ribosomal protein S1/4-hydroxy-3-methylbut-2-enyl diphosphate reductase [Alkaliphilus hydrothermalis]
MSDMQNFMDEIEKSMVRLHSHDVVTGKVINVTDNEIMVNVGYKSDGIIPRDEISNDYSVNPRSLVKIGDEIKVYVIKVDDGEGNVLLSKKRVDMEKGWEDLEKIKDSDALLEAKVVEVVRGGVIAIARGIRCFIPASQLSDTYVEDLTTFVGKNFNTRVIEIDRRKNKAVLSRKVVLKQEKEESKKEVFSNIEKGQRISGTVRNIADFGAFVDIGGVDGLVHISDLSWNRVKHPSNLLKVGQKVEVEVLDFDMDKERISLGMKQLQPQPWDLAEEKYQVGEVVTGKVVRMVDYGAFVELEPGLDGLVHISEISEGYVKKPSEVLEVGQEVSVKVLEVNAEQKRISLSISAANKTEVEPEFKNEEGSVTIGDVINSADDK